MSLGEFDLIARYFTRPVRRMPLGVGDDCALLALAHDEQLAVSCDMLVQGQHFLPDIDPQRLGHKALAVNLSDLAACGAQPLAFTLAMALPGVDEAWLAAFSNGLLTLADANSCELIGGDTTKGPLNICISVFGSVPRGQALLRSGARGGDDLYVSGSVGDARLALEALRGTVRLPEDSLQAVRSAMERPQPRIALGKALRGVASSAIDISDGLVGDLGHLLRRSGVGATLDVDAAARSAVLAAQPLALQRQCALAGGDDYELLFTAPRAKADAAHAAAAESQVRITRIGGIESQAGLRLVDGAGRFLTNCYDSFDHFTA